MTQYIVRFESTGFSDHMGVADNCLGEKELDAINQALPKGVIKVTDVHASADDAQGDTDIHTFISVSVLADTSNLPINAAMILFLDRVTETLVAGDENGEIHMDHFSWELVDVEAFFQEKRAA